jgi:Uma2 family endonuclease
MTSATVAPEILDQLFYDELHRYELVDGVLEEKPMVSIYHSLLMLHLGRLLLNQLEELGKSDELWALGDLLAKIRDDHWRRPDIAVIKAEDAEPWKYVMPGHWPVLCVEIVSPPHQSVEELLDKCQLYHEQGVPHCWVLEPESRAAWMFDRGSERLWIPSDGRLTAGTTDLALKPADLWCGLHDKRGKS